MTLALTDNLPLIAAAPDGIKVLRGLILDLAVRGKLVPQDPEDEPASELLVQIENERRRLIEAGSIKKATSRASRSVSEFEVPQGWSSALLGDIIGSIDSGWSPACLAEPSPSEEIWGVLKTTAVQPLNYLEAENKHLPPNLPPKSEYEVRPGDILITRAGPKNRVGVSCLVQHTRPRLMISDKIIRIQVVGDIIDARFVCLAMNAGVTAEFLEASKSGMAESQMNISQEKLRTAPLAVPPLAEQRRIVAKVDELMALCDRLEAQQADAEAVHATLVKTLLDTLTQSQNADDFAANWQRLSQHFPTIFTTEASVDALKQVILQLAIMGKLSRQSPDDGQVAELFDSQAKYDEARICGITVENLPFVVPETWIWARLGDLLQDGRGISYGVVQPEKEPASGGVYMLRCSDVKPRHLDLTGVRKIADHIDAAYSRTRIKGGEVLINIRGTIGGVALATRDVVGFNIAREVAMIPLNPRLCGAYIVSALASPFFSGVVTANLRGLAYQGINLNSLREFLVPLPPRKEQERIVAKVDELLALCDTLKGQIAESRTAQRQLATASVEQTLVA